MNLFRTLNSLVNLRNPRTLNPPKTPSPEMSSSACNRLTGLFTKTPKPKPKPNPNPKPISASKEPSSSGPPEVIELIKRFKSNSRSTDFRKRQNNYNSMIHRLASKNHFSAIETILEDQKKYIPETGEGFAVKLIGLYGKAGMFDHAYKVFDELPNLNCPRTVISFNALLSACVKSKNYDKVGEFFEQLPGELGMEPDVFSYNIVINGFCESNDFGSAVEWIEKMEDGPVKPDIVSYNTVLEGYYKENDLNEVEKWLRRMEEKGVVANVRTYNSRIRSLIGKGQVEEALELVEKMEKEDVNPDTHTYNAVIKGCRGNDDLERTKMFHGKMVGDKCLPDYATYQMLIPLACEKGDIDFALELCKQSVELNVPVYQTVVQRVVDALIKTPRIEEANELVALVNSSKINRYTLTLPGSTVVD